jgi:hypothetical protein
MFKNRKIILIILISLSLLGLFFYTPQTVSKEEIVLVAESVKTSNAILEINGQKYESEIKNSISVYDFMDKLRSEGKISFTEKNYTGIGKFIDTINEVRGNGDKNWIYYVNNKKAQVGVSNYKIKPGDLVSWKYEKENY